MFSVADLQVGKKTGLQLSILHDLRDSKTAASRNMSGKFTLNFTFKFLVAV